MTSNDLRHGITLMVSFLLLVAITSIFFPHQLDDTEYHGVDSSLLLSCPNDYEGIRVSTAVTIAGFSNETTAQGQLLETTDGLALLIPTSLPNVTAGDHISFRGTSYLSSLGYIEVTELHIHDYPIDGISRSLLYSLPGILAFIALFFAVFRFDTTRFRFVSRRD